MHSIGEIDVTEPGHNVVYGKNDEGKSTIMAKIVDEVPNQRIAIIDYHSEYTKAANQPNVDRYIPNAQERNDEEQRMDFLRWALAQIKQRRYDVIIIDEFNQYVHNTKFETPYELEDMKNNIAHEEWNSATSFLLMRRPSQGDSDFRETANNIVCAGLQGKRAVKALDDRVDGFGQAAKHVVGTHRFAVLTSTGYFWINEPVDESYATAKR